MAIGLNDLKSTNKQGSKSARSIDFIASKDGGSEEFPDTSYLDDLPHKSTLTEVIKPETECHKNQVDHKGKTEDSRGQLSSKILRPWERVDEQNLSTQTASAREAVKRAQQIIEKNNLMIEEIYKRRKEKKMWREIPQGDLIAHDSLFPEDFLGETNSNIISKFFKFFKKQ